MSRSPTTTIITSPQSSDPEALWPFTPFDKASLTWIIRGTWIFPEQLDVSRLQESFRTLLGFYPHLTGRMEWDKGIRLNNAGIPFAVADEPDASIADLMAHHTMADQFSLPLSKRHIKSGKSAVMCIKYTTVKDGSVLGVRCSHSVLDGASFYGMVASWARLCSGQSIERPHTDQTLLMFTENPFSGSDIVKTALSKGFVKIGLNIVLTLLQMKLFNYADKRSRGFYFSAETLKKMKQQVSEAAGCPCSTNEALSAYLIRMCARLNGHAETATRYSSVNVVDSRGRIRSVPKNFIGNASSLVCTPALPANAPVAFRARTIHDALAPALRSPSSALLEFAALAVAVVKKKALLLPFDAAKAFCTRPTNIYINNFFKFPIYDVDFGKGRPCLVIPHNLADPVLIWPAHPDNGGIEVYFAGGFACAIDKLKPDDLWFGDMERPENNLL